MKFVAAGLLVAILLSPEVGAWRIKLLFRESNSVRLVNVSEKHFLDHYLSLLTDCDIDGISQLYADSYTAFNEEGDSLNKTKTTNSQEAFCSSPLGSTKFSVIEARTLGGGVFFDRVKAENKLFKNGPVLYSFATTVKSGMIVFEVQSANSEAFARAIREEATTDAVEV